MIKLTVGRLFQRKTSIILLKEGQKGWHWIKNFISLHKVAALTMTPISARFLHE